MPSATTHYCEGEYLVDALYERHVAAPTRDLGTIPANFVLVCFPPAPSSKVSSAPCILGSQWGWQRRQVAILFRRFGDSDNGEAVNLSQFLLRFRRLLNRWERFVVSPNFDFV